MGGVVFTFRNRSVEHADRVSVRSMNKVETLNRMRRRVKAEYVLYQKITRFKMEIKVRVHTVE